MRRLFVPTMGPSDWRRLLADPQKQWREAKSAYEAAIAWEAARNGSRGLPPEVATLLDSQSEFRGASLLLGLPEHQVELEGGGHASQTDFWALLSAPIGIVSTAVEAKAGEPFDKRVSEWLSERTAKSGKPKRLEQLCTVLAIDQANAMDCRYQLVHRPVAAILEAKRFNLKTALFLVQAFAKNAESFKDYEHWARLFGVQPGENTLHRAGALSGIELWIGWVGADPAADATVRAAV
jgi:hypothetical protein